MARTGFIHHFGTFLLFSATVLLIITCISAPVVRSIALLKVELPGDSNDNNNGEFGFLPDQNGNDPSISFGVFGYCLNNIYGGQCPRGLGYSPLGIIENIVGPNRGQSTNPNFSPSQTFGEFYSSNSESTSRALTKAMVLHPIAAGFNFLAFILALGAGMVGSLLASLVALLAFLITAVACIIDFVLFGIVRSNLSNGWDSSDDEGDSLGLQVERVYYDNAAWMTLAAAVLSLVGAVVVFFSCCSGRIHKRRERKRAVKGEVPPVSDYGTPVAPRRRRWF
ncbi:SUR7/PalI family-domain-containing protein [Triangularia verruculosa]|uniref:SUR7/PalI family-domain-containing protein n=1 Tax=Triangularia verruculosa TaxID=2587418 RepID=A0AAN7AW48_9PEZI|nr:SUR7/PalI family-domain-containing protein [Triangularia verruculosa]